MRCIRQKKGGTDAGPAETENASLESHSAAVTPAL